MPVAVVGASHHTTPIELRERLAFGRGELAPALAAFAAAHGCEAVLLSTCNRTELYLACAPGSDAVEQAAALLAARLGDQAADAARFLYVHRPRAAAEHLFRVTAGLESMIVGEPQIQGQVKDAYAA